MSKNGPWISGKDIVSDLRKVEAERDALAKEVELLKSTHMNFLDQHNFYAFALRADLAAVRARLETALRLGQAMAVAWSLGNQLHSSQVYEDWRRFREENDK